MSLSNNQNFWARQKAFLDVSPILSFDEQAGPVGGGDTSLRTVGSREFVSVRGYSRIRGIDIRDGAAARYLVTAPPDESGDKIRREGYLPSYWLPWGTDRSIRTTLRPRSQTTAMGLVKYDVLDELYPQSPSFPGIDSNDPPIFVTSAVNGCSVVVEGSREQPTVYHANAMATGGSPRDIALRPDATAPDVRRAIDAKVAFMQTQVRTFATARPRILPGGQVVQPRKMLTQTDYMIYVHSQGRTVPGKGYETEVTNLLRDVAAANGVTNDTRVRRIG
jgi:hypothetical protein